VVLHGARICCVVRDDERGRRAVWCRLRLRLRDGGLSVRRELVYLQVLERACLSWVATARPGKARRVLDI
jgi:hypothetical protein